MELPYLPHTMSMSMIRFIYMKCVELPRSIKNTRNSTSNIYQFTSHISHAQNISLNILTSHIKRRTT